MAKQQNQTTENQRTMPVHPDPNKETILLRYPEDGSVKVVSDLKTDAQGKCHPTTVEPSIKNQAAFYQRLDSQFIANFFKNMRAQMKDPTKMPELYIVPYDKVPMVAEDLRKLQGDPQNDLLRETAANYRTYTQTLEKIKYDQARMPKAQLAAAGFDIAKLEADGAFKKMEQGLETDKLYPLKKQLNDDVSIDGLYAIRPTHDQGDNTKFELVAPLAVPEFEIDEQLKMGLSQDDKTALFNGRTLGRALYHDGEYCMAGFNRNTGRMIYVPCNEVKVPDFIMNCRLKPEQQDEYKRGGRIRLESCHYYNNDNAFSCEVQYDVHTRSEKTFNHVYSRPYIPDYLDRQLMPEQRKELETYQILSRQGLKDRNGEPLKRDICMSRETNSIVYLSKQAQAEMQTRTQAQSPQSEKATQQIPDFDIEDGQEKSVGRGRKI